MKWLTGLYWFGIAAAVLSACLDWQYIFGFSLFFALEVTLIKLGIVIIQELKP